MSNPTPAVGCLVSLCQRCSGLGEVAMMQGVRSIKMMVRPCPSCGGTGEAIYTRGVSLVPLVPRRR